MLNSFHPAVKEWFIEKFGNATDIQLEAWPEIQQWNHTLIAAPTGSGKTLAAFLAIIDELIKKGLSGDLEQETKVVYISPLKALSNDIQKNLQEPILGIRKKLKEMGYADVKLSAKVRTGDTTQSERAGMLKAPPHIIVTTPESLFLLLTSDGGRKMLSSVDTLIMDEIHAIVEDKRGSHLSVTMERLEHLCNTSLRRIGISATQKPIEETARFLVGTHNCDNKGKPNCVILDSGHQRQLDLDIEIPDSPLTAIMANEVWTEIYDKLVDLIENHETTLIFVNTRRLAERLAFDLRLRVGEDAITAHHGSLSKEQRQDAENRLKTGQLKALVATASLELGIDIGSIDLVCQISSPRKISAFLQRIGRAGHSIGKIPKGRIFPLTRDDLLECTALLDAVRRKELDRLVIPTSPVDILSQQIIACTACEEWKEEDLFKLLKKSYAFKDLDKKLYTQTLEMLTVGFTNRRGYKRAYLHRDIVNNKLNARKGARLAVLTSGGAIPDLFDFDVYLEPANIKVGTINEDFAIESMPGDVFQLGNNSWRILKVENGKVRVEDAQGMPPTIPFWLGEAPGRTDELSEAVSRIRSTIDDLFDKASGKVINEEGELVSSLANTGRPEDYDYIKAPALDWLTSEVGISVEAAEQLVSYLLNAKLALGAIPTQSTLMLERFFDEAGDMHLVIHSPYGSDMNTAWGLALRKRFCRGFNFELQAAATEDAIILSLSQTHSFPLEDIYNYLHSNTVRHITIQAMLDNPIFEIRWRWNATRAMAVLRNRNGKKVPPALQRMESEDLIALAFPDQIACLENIVGDREIPDHPLVHQTIDDCLTEAMDIDLLEEVLKRKEQGEIKLLTADLREPSPLAQEIINARPYAFLDDAPAEERRTRAIQSRKWMDPSEAAELGTINPEAIKMVMQEAWPRVIDHEELHDALVLLGFLTEEEGMAGDGNIDWKVYLHPLIEQKRATIITLASGKKIWASVERLPQLAMIYGDLNCSPQLKIPEVLLEKVFTREEALLEVLRGRMESCGPVTVNELKEKLDWTEFDVQSTLLALENQGFVFQGKYTQNTNDTEWVERRLLHRMHKYTLQKLRKEIEPIAAADFMRFLFEWQHVVDSPEGPQALQNIILQLEGYEAQAASWETEILAARIKNYDPMLLDVLSLSGRIMWGRLRPYKPTGTKKTSPIKTTPIVLVQRENYDLWKTFGDQQEPVEFGHQTTKVYAFLKENGASFFDEIVRNTKLLNSQVEVALDEMAAHGLVTSDSFTGLRALLTPSNNRPGENRLRRNGKKAIYGMEHAGRWSVLEHKEIDLSKDIQKENIEKIAWILLKRYGVVFRRMCEQEKYLPPWRDLVRVYRRMEARGEIRGGYFVAGMSGEQYALPEVISQLRAIRKKEKKGEEITISGVYPLNLTGIVTPVKRISNSIRNRITYKDGIPVVIKEGDDIHYLEKLGKEDQWRMQNEIIKQRNLGILKAYLGKGFR